MLGKQYWCYYVPRRVDRIVLANTITTRPDWVEAYASTVSHKISETNSSFHVN